MKDYVEIFNDSYERIVRDDDVSDEFFAQFYEIFISKSSLIAEKFKNTDMASQREMLRESLMFMVNFYVHKRSDAFLRELAMSHSRKGVDIEPYLYDIWMDSVIDTLRERDAKFDRDVELAWRIVLSPGITFMKFHY